jgi:SAM-dependent methyltransferase
MGLRELKRSLGTFIPYPVIFSARKFLHYGRARRCVVCGSWVRSFRPQGYQYGINAELEVIGSIYKLDDECPICHSNDRTRLVLMYLKTRTSFFTSPCSLLHFAPEKGLTLVFEKAPNVAYSPVDLDPNRYRHAGKVGAVDITAIPFQADRFDYIICNHVLEHVDDDRAAMRELCRVLKPGGIAILQVPISLKLERTREDPTVTTPEKRITCFGQHDHVRLYARDYADRLRESGFDVEAIDMTAQYPEQAKEYQIDPQELLYIATKK